MGKENDKRQLTFGDLDDDQADDPRQTKLPPTLRPGAPPPAREILPGRDAPYAAGSETSYKAAKAIKPRAPNMRAKVLAYVASQGSLGATCDEVVRATGIIHQTCSPRMNELRAEHMIADSGRKRPTSSGQDADVMVITKLGLDELQRVGLA